MIVWGGADFSDVVDSGGKYNPATNTWLPTSTTNAPSPRQLHTAVWTGSEMIIWGGDDISDYFDTGGRYNPMTDNWGATSITNAPASRSGHTAVWTGNDMIVWGGTEGLPTVFDTGADPMQIQMTG